MTWHVHSTLNSPLYPGGAKTAKASERKLLAQQWAFRISGVLDRTKIDEEMWASKKEETEGKSGPLVVLLRDLFGRILEEGRPERDSESVVNKGHRLGVAWKNENNFWAL